MESLEAVFEFFTFPKTEIQEEGCRIEQSSVERLNPSKINKNTLVSVPSGTCWYQMGRGVCLGSDWPTFIENVVENK